MSSSPTSSRPDIVFIVADDLGYADLGCYGERFSDILPLAGGKMDLTEGGAIDQHGLNTAWTAILIDAAGATPDTAYPPLVCGHAAAMTTPGDHFQ